MGEEEEKIKSAYGKMSFATTGQNAGNAGKMGISGVDPCCLVLKVL